MQKSKLAELFIGLRKFIVILGCVAALAFSNELKLDLQTKIMLIGLVSSYVGIQGIVDIKTAQATVKAASVLYQALLDAVKLGKGEEFEKIAIDKDKTFN